MLSRSRTCSHGRMDLLDELSKTQVDGTMNLLDVIVNELLGSYTDAIIFMGSTSKTIQQAVSPFVNHVLLGRLQSDTREWATPVVSALRGDDQVTSVSVIGTDIDNGLAAMLLMVKRITKIKTLCGFTHEETVIDLSNMFLGSADAMLIAPELRVVTSLTQVCQHQASREMFILGIS